MKEPYNGPSASGRSAQDPISLRLWLFKFNPEQFQVTVEGYFTCDKEGTLRNWGTSAIKKRHKATLLESETGKFYKLVGEIDEGTARSFGYPITLVKCFKQGFPGNWEKQLREYYDVVKATNPLNASVWFEKNHRRESSMSALRDDVQNAGGGQASGALRKRHSRLSVLPSVPVIAENSFEADESVKENRAKTPKSAQHKAVTETITAEATTFRRSPRLAICDTPHNVIGQQQKPSDTPHATLEIVETPRRGRPPTKDKKEVERQKSATPAGTPRKTPNQRAKTPRGTIPAPASTPRATRSATRENTPAITTASKSTPRPASAKSRDVTPAPEKTPKSTPRKSNAKATNAAATTPQTEQEAAALADTPTSSKSAKDKKIALRGQSIDSHIAKKPSPKPQIQDETPILAGSPIPLPPPPSNQDSVFKMPEMPAKKKQRGHIIAVMGTGKPQTLSDWHIRFMPELEKKSTEHPPFILVGQNTDKPDMTQEWNTTIIARVSPEGTSFFTFRGSEYRIQGEINVTAMAKDGFNKTVCADFFFGFPENWVQTLWTAYNQKKGVPVDGDDREQPIVTHPASDGEASHKSAYKKRKSNPSDASSNVSNLSIVPYDQSRLNNSGEVQTSSRGRVVKPVMPSWAGQRVRYSTSGEVIGMETSVVHCDEAVDMNSFADHFGVPRVEEAHNRKRKSFTGALHVEMDGRERVQPKKRLVTYTSSSSGDDSDDAVTRTLRMIDYDQMPMSKHRRASKARRLNEETTSEEEREKEDMVLRKIAKRKKKALKDLKALDKLQLKLLATREERRRRRKAAEHVRRREEEFELEQMEMERQQKHRKSLQPKKMKQQQKKKQPKRQVYEEETSDDDVFEEQSSGDSGDSSSTDTDVSDGGEWVRTPAQKRGVQRMRQQKMKKNARKEQKKAQPRGGQKQKKQRVMESDDESEKDEEEEEEEEEIVRKERKPKVKKPTWNERDLERLKLALKASKVRSEEDWEVIARSLGGQFPADDCKEMAIKKLKWIQETNAHARNNNDRDSDEGEMRVTARQGTVAYQIQADQQSRKYMMGAGSQEEDVFRNREMRDEEEDDFVMPNVGEFDPDDSLIEALKTPTQAPPVGRKGANRRPFMAGPLIGDDDTPTIVKRRSSTVRNEEMDSVERENHQRRLRHLLNDNRKLNSTRMNNTSTVQNYSMMDNSRAVNNIGKKVDRIRREVEKQKPKKKREFDEEDEDEEEEEDEY